MCECLRGIFRVTWTPSSDADSDPGQEDGHVCSQNRDQAVKDKRRTPPPTRSPSAPQCNSPHSGTGITGEQESPERVVQKEKLHAELKRVLSQKRSHLRECQLAQPEMDPEPTEEQTGVEDVSNSVEIVVETEAEAGASGYSVTGGGEHGIFVKDVLKDSPAAKHLSLQQGDQLLSAKVYFDNVRYEDALKILQCAEPYKVSFLVKRTIPGAEVTTRPRVPSGELKGPRAKVAKMSVKGTKQFKTQKKRGGRFGLKRLKEKRREEIVIEGTQSRLGSSDVDVEFSLPKVKQRKSGKPEADATGTAGIVKAKKKIRFPHMKSKAYTGAKAQEDLEIVQLEGDENIPPSEMPGAKVKTKIKGHKFGITFPRSKYRKSSSGLDLGSVELKASEVGIQPPSVEVSMSADKDMDVEKSGSKFKAPDVEFTLPGKAGASLPTGKGKAETKDLKANMKVDANPDEGKVNQDATKGEAKLRIPKLRLPKVRFSRHSDEIDGDIKRKIEGGKSPQSAIKEDGKISLPEFKGDTPEGKSSVKIPSVDFALPKMKIESETECSLPGQDVAEKVTINRPAFDISVPEVDLKMDTKGRVSDEVEGTIKGPKINMPQVDISLPKMESPAANIEYSKGGGKLNLPSVDISLPKVKSDNEDVHMGQYVGGDGKFKMPDFDITLPKVRSSKEEMDVSLKLPKADLTLPKTNDEENQLPYVDISLPKWETAEVEVDSDAKGGKFKMPTANMPKTNIMSPAFQVKSPEVEGEVELHGPDAKQEMFKMPVFNINLPNIGTTKSAVSIEVPETEASSADISLRKTKCDVDVEGKIKGLPSASISLPKIILPGGNVELDSTQSQDIDFSLNSSNLELKGKDGSKFKMPTFNVSLPKGNSKEKEVSIEGHEIKGRQEISIRSSEIKANIDSKVKDTNFKMRSLDVSLPETSADISLLKIQSESKSKGGHFHIPTVDVSLPKIKFKGGELNAKGPELNTIEPKATTIDITPPQGTIEGDIDTKYKGNEFEISLPTADISLSDHKVQGGDVHFQGPKVKSGTFEMPRVDFSLPEGKEHGNIDIDIHSGIEGNAEITPYEIKHPKGQIESGVNIKGPKVKAGKLKMPKFKTYFPKLGTTEGDVKIEEHDVEENIKMPSTDISTSKGKIEGDLDISSHGTKGATFHMPSININLPNLKSKELDADVKTHEGYGENLGIPSLGISGPKIKPSGIDAHFEGPDVETSLPKLHGDVELRVEGPQGQPGKVKIPKYDISLPKVNFPEGEVYLKGPELKSRKIDMPDIDISLPKGKLDGDIEAHARKEGRFHIPSVDFSLPRIKGKGPEVNLEGPELKGDINTQDIDISLQKGKAEVDINVDRSDQKGGKFKMPKFDISLPTSLYEGSTDKPKADISIPKEDIRADTYGNLDRDGKFCIPSIDFSFPTVKVKGADVNIEGADLKGDITLPEGNIEGSLSAEGPNVKGKVLNMPTLDLSLSKEKNVGKDDVEFSQAGKFNLPKFDVSLPKVNLPDSGLKTEEAKVKKGKFEVPNINIDVHHVKVEGETESGTYIGKKSKFHIPSVDIALPKIKAKGSEISVECPQVQGGMIDMPGPEVHPPAVDVVVEGSDFHEGKVKISTFDVALPHVKPEGGVNVAAAEIKGGKIKMPKFDVSIPKMNLPNFSRNVEGPEITGVEISTGDVSLPKSKTDVEMDADAGASDKFQMPSVDLTLPKLKGKGGGADIHGPIIQGDISLPKIKSPEVEISLKGPEVEGGKVDLPNTEVSIPKGKIEGDVKVAEVKGGKFKMPKFDVNLPKISLPQVDANIGGTDMKENTEISSTDLPVPKPKIDVETGKGGKFNLPSVDISLPKIRGKGGDSDIQGPKFKADLSRSKLKPPEADISLKDPNVEGGKVDLPGVNTTLPKGNIDSDYEVQGPEVKGCKFKMPKMDMSLPTIEMSLPKVTPPESDVKIKGTDIKVGKIELPDIDLSLSKRKTEELSHTGKGGKIHMPTIDIHLPKMKAKGSEIGIEGPEFRGGQIGSPVSDLSLPKANIDADISIEGPGARGGKVKMPKFDVSLPKPSLPEGSIKVDVPDAKGNIEKPDTKTSLQKGKLKGVVAEKNSGKKGKFHMPSVDISLPIVKPKAVGVDINVPKVGISPTVVTNESEINVEESIVKGGKLKMPTFDVALPKVNDPKFDKNLKDQERKGGKTEMPHIDVNTPKGKSGDLEIHGEVGKAKFQIPSVDITLPKIKAKGPEVNFECPEVEGGKLNLNLTSPTKPHLPEVQLGFKEVEGPGITGKVQVPGADVSLPELNTEAEIDVTTGKSSKIHFPSIDISLPKMKAKGGQTDGSLSKIMLLDVDVSLKGPAVQKGQIDTSPTERNIDGDLEVEGKFPMPKTDMSLPKPNPQKSDINIKGPDIKAGNIELPDINLSLPKSKVTGEMKIEGQTSKGGKFQMPSVSLPRMGTSAEVPESGLDIEGPNMKNNKLKMPKVAISVPKINLSGADVKVEGPELKGGNFVPAGEVSPTKRIEGDIDIQGSSGQGMFELAKPKSNEKHGRLHMPTLDMNMPKFNLDLNLASGQIEKNQKSETSGPDVSRDPVVYNLKGDIKPGQMNQTGDKKGEVKAPDSSLKLPSIKLPTVDISVPKMNLDFGLSRPEGDNVEVELLKAEDGRPSSGGSFDLPDISLKGPSFSLPTTSGKPKIGELEVSLPKQDISLNLPDVEGEIRAPSVEIDKNDKVKVKRHKIKMPSFGISRKNVDTSRSSDLKKDVDFNVETSDNKAKHRIKFPKFKMSSSKVESPEREVDADVDAQIDSKGGVHGPDVTIKLPKFSMPGFSTKEKDFDETSTEAHPKIKIPSVELSLPTAKTPESEVLLPKTEVDVSEADIKGYEGNLKIPKIPTINVSVPKVDLDVFLPKGKPQIIEGTEVEVNYVKLPEVDIALPKMKTDKKDLTDVNAEVEGGELKKTDIKLENTEISQGKTGGLERPDMKNQGRRKFKMPHVKVPRVDISLPIGIIEGPEVAIKDEREELKSPSVDISLPKIKVKTQDVKTEEGSGEESILSQWKMPEVDVSPSKGHIEGPEVKVKGAFKKPHVSKPSVELSQSKGKTEGTDNEKDIGGKIKMPYVKIPSVDLPKRNIEEPDVDIKENVGGKFKKPHLKMPNVELLLPQKKGNEGMEIEGEGGKFKSPHISMPSVDISLQKGKFEGPKVGLEGGAGGKSKMTHVESSSFQGEASGDSSLAKGRTEGSKPDIVGEGVKCKMPKVDISLSKGKPSAEAPDVGHPSMPSMDSSIPGRKAIVEIPEKETEAEKVIIKLPHIKMPKVSLPKGKSKNDSVITGLEIPGAEENKELKLKMPTIKIKGPTEDTELNIACQQGDGNMEKKRVELPDLDLTTTGAKGKGKGHKAKGKKFKIGGVKKKISGDITSEDGGGDEHNKDENGKKQSRFQTLEPTLPNVAVKTETEGAKGQSQSSKDVKVPRIPDIEFDIGTAQDDDDDQIQTEKKIKIPKFGVPLPSLSDPDRFHQKPEVQYEGPRMPKVKKAVFVLVNPNDKNDQGTNIPKEEATCETETGDVKLKKLKIKTKSKDKSEVVHIERVREEEITMPKMGFSSGKSTSSDITLRLDGSKSNEESVSHKGSKDEKGTFSGKLKFPKVEFTSPYAKNSSGEETETRVQTGKDLSSEAATGGIQSAEATPKTTKNVVSSHARTEMLESSESSIAVSSTKVLWSEVVSRGKPGEEKDPSTWFKVPKISLKPHSTGFLQITPEGSPQAQRRGQVGGGADVSGSFCLHASGLDLTSTEEHRVSSTGEGTVTTVTTRTTRQLVTSETRTGDSSTTTTRRALDFDY